MSEKTVISLKKINKSFPVEKDGSFKVLADINLEVTPGEFLVCVGPSGSGKSTLLRIMSGLDKSFSGSAQFDSGEKIKRGFVFQKFAIFPWLTVHQNVELALLNSGLAEKEIKKVVEKQLDEVGLIKFAKSYPKELSGGMQQRVGIARALVNNPEVIFMDEPFSELDSFTAEELRNEILKIWQARRVTIVLVSHLVEEAVELGDTIIVFTPNPGKIKAVIKNNLPRPREKRSQEFYDLEDRITALIKP